MIAKQVGVRLCELCRDGRNVEAVDELYSDHVISIEPSESNSPIPQIVEGKAHVQAKSEKWLSTFEVHSAEVEGPLMHGNRFAVIFAMDVTSRESGERFRLKEVGIYEVANGRIVREEFYFNI